MVYNVKVQNKKNCPKAVLYILKILIRLLARPCKGYLCSNVRSIRSI